MSARPGEPVTYSSYGHDMVCTPRYMMGVELFLEIWTQSWFGQSVPPGMLCFRGGLRSRNTTPLISQMVVAQTLGKVKLPWATFPLNQISISIPPSP